MFQGIKTIQEQEKLEYNHSDIENNFVLRKLILKI